MGFSGIYLKLRNYYRQKIIVKILLLLPKPTDKTNGFVLREFKEPIVRTKIFKDKNLKRGVED